jgi:hypothetical protein
MPKGISGLIPRSERTIRPLPNPHLSALARSQRATRDLVVGSDGQRSGLWTQTTAVGPTLGAACEARRQCPRVEAHEFQRANACHVRFEGRQRHLFACRESMMADPEFA